MARGQVERGGERRAGGRAWWGEGVFLVNSSQGSHECPESVGNVGVQGPPGGHGGSGLGIAHVVCAVDRQALQVAARLGGRGLVRREVMGCRERREVVNGTLSSAGGPTGGREGVPMTSFHAQRQSDET